MFAAIDTVGVTDGDVATIGADLSGLATKIRSQYLGDADATVVLVGRSTWTRRFVDWEIAATLAGGPDGRRALLGLALPSLAEQTARLPDRLAANLGVQEWPGYAVMTDYPSNPSQLAHDIDRALSRRRWHTPSDQSFSPLVRRDLTDRTTLR